MGEIREEKRREMLTTGDRWVDVDGEERDLVIEKLVTRRLLVREEIINGEGGEGMFVEMGGLVYKGAWVGGKLEVQRLLAKLHWGRWQRSDDLQSLGIEFEEVGY